MNFSKEIIKKFGGQTALASLLGKGQSTVAYWVKTGSIPARWQQKLILLASERGIDLTPDDFMPKPQQERHEGTSMVEFQNNSAESYLSVREDEQPIGDCESPFIFYASPDGSVKVHVLVGDETVWASQQGMAEIFDTSKQNISYHLSNIFKELELEDGSVVKEILTTAADGKNYPTNFYHIDAIISVGYRVNSVRATQFRRWATSVLREYMIKGYALDDDRLKQGNQLFGKDYFDELLARIREIRASERRFYQKITDLYAQCSVDYDKNSPITQKFYADVQDKLHYAIHGHTSAELIKLRADAKRPHMGLRSYKNEKTGGKITKTDVTVGKNYLIEEELRELERLVSMYLDFAENFARRHKLMTMQKWANRLDGFLEFNAYDVLDDFGNVSRESAKQHAIREYEKFRVTQDKEFKSDFDKVIDEIKVTKKLPN